MFLFSLDASIRVEGSQSRTLVDVAEQQWPDAHPYEPVAHRRVVADPIPAAAWATAVSAISSPNKRTAEQDAVSAYRPNLADEAGARTRRNAFLPVSNDRRPTPNLIRLDLDHTKSGGNQT